MEYETCPTCGQKMWYDDVTKECELEWVGTGDKYLVLIRHLGKAVTHLGPGCTLHQPSSKDYHIEEISKTLDGSGWWFRVLKLRR